MAHQLSVFIGNQSGRFHEVARVLAENGVNILSFSLADTADYGILRMICDNTEKGLEALRANSITARLTDVLLVPIEPQIGSLTLMLDVIGTDVNIAYMYPYSTQGPDAGMVLKVDEPELVKERLLQANFSVA